jgi:hypothetical protein
LELDCANNPTAYPSPGNYSKPIKQVIKTLSIDHMKEFLSKFSG